MNSCNYGLPTTLSPDDNTDVINLPSTNHVQFQAFERAGRLIQHAANASRRFSEPL
jgi:hypothetical protein